MGTVYHGYQATVQRDVAIKILPAVMAQDPAFIARFRQEAKVIANLGHARILPVHDYGEQDGMAYLVMRYLNGGTLRQRIEKSGQLDIADAARILRQVAEGLNFAHNQGIIHRDLTANNIMFDTAGDAYITDFGLAKIMENSAQLTGSAIVGTPAYMSPEQGLDSGVDHRADIYALGVVLFEMLTGDVPFHGSSAMVVVVKHINEPIPDPLEKRPDLSPAVVAVILRATEKDPNNRFQSCLEMANAMDTAIRQSGVSARLKSPAAGAPAVSTPSASKARPAAAASDESLPAWLIPVGIVGLIAVIAIIGVVYVVLSGGRQASGLITATSTIPAAAPTSAATEAPSLPTVTASVAATEETLPPAPTDSGPEVAPGGEIPAPEPGIIQCDAPRETIFAHDFQADKPQGLALVLDNSRTTRFDEGWLVMGPMPREAAAQLYSGGPIDDPLVRMAATLDETPGALRLTVNAGPSPTENYTLFFDPRQQEVRLERGPQAIARTPMTVDLHDNRPHDVTFSKQGGRISASLDGQILFEYDDPSPVPGGMIILNSAMGNLKIDWLGVCGIRQ
jgi:serine/threonine-protein kinase